MPSLLFNFNLVQRFLINNEQSLNRIYSHEFNRQLFSGSLAPESFSYYLRQDHRYLQNYASILSKIALRLKPQYSQYASLFERFANDVVIAEQEMQKTYLSDLSQPAPIEKAIQDYLNHLYAKVKHESVEEAMASVLPCFWIYCELGRRLKTQPENRYQAWIDTYVCNDFLLATRQMADMVNEIGCGKSAALHSAMEKAFSDSVNHELAFFNESILENELQISYNSGGLW
ncbi:TenA family protein [Legionella dresdenensis]|uniref:TenA family protein n=1 Tax=Legionella dresdenensis TaxID=450200 RepID=A0ABV8CGM9_9GAMM